MSTHAARLARLFTPYYACRINAQIVHPNVSRLVKPNELESALARPLQVSIYEPRQPSHYLAATLSYGIINGIALSLGRILLLMLQFQDIHSWMETKEPVIVGKYSALTRGLHLPALFPAFFLANEYLRAMGLAGLADNGKVGVVYDDISKLADGYVNTAAGRLNVQELADSIGRWQ